MIRLEENNLYHLNRKSSKGNQLKWNVDQAWYKADYLGYEGLAETVISKLLIKSSLKKDEFIEYETEEIEYKEKVHLGCKSMNFIPEGWQLITLERLYNLVMGRSLYQTIFSIEQVDERLKFMVSEVARITGIEGFGSYLAKIITIDALFLNEDRHFHNIALLMDQSGKYHLCPIFDQGLSLLSDTKFEYPLKQDIYKLIKNVRSKTISMNFDEQLDAAEQLFGKAVTFNFTKKDVKQELEKIESYPSDEKERVYDIICHQMDKYRYLFSSKR